MIEDEANGNILPNLKVHSLHNIPTTPTNSYLVSSSSPRNSASSNDGFPTPEQKKKHNTDFESKKLNRGISRATDNVNLVSQARSEILIDSCEQEYCLETPIHTFTLPDINCYPDDFRQFLVKDLIAVSTQDSLEQANRLNWWTSYCQRLWPLSTSGDGNCLLHAASLGMWGFHDRLLTLRKTLHSYLTQSPRKDALWRRWRRQQDILNAQAGLVYSEVEWRQEWNALVNMASSEPRLRRLSVQSEHGCESTAGNIYESLEEIHVLALAHVIKRPIIVVADTVLKDLNGDDLAPIPFGGIYLPLECAPSECHRSPLLLAFDGGHFSALVPMDNSNPSNLASAIPLTDMNGDLLPIQFSVDPGNNGNMAESHDLTYCQNIDLLSTYLDLIRIEPNSIVSSDDGKNGKFGSFGKSVGQRLRMKLIRSISQRQSKTILCAVLHSDKRHEYHDAMIKNYLETASLRFQLQQDNKKEVDGVIGVVAEDALLASGPRYNSGKSQFYTEADKESHEKVSQLTPVKQPPQRPDPTLYLCNSTFYQPAATPPTSSPPSIILDGPSQPCRVDSCAFFGNPLTENYCSKCYHDIVGSHL